jgi:hypothetical protein
MIKTFGGKRLTILLFSDVIGLFRKKMNHKIPFQIRTNLRQFIGVILFKYMFGNLSQGTFYENFHVTHHPRNLFLNVFLNTYYG